MYSTYMWTCPMCERNIEIAYTVMYHWTLSIHSVKFNLGWFHYWINITECTYLNKYDYDASRWYHALEPPSCVCHCWQKILCCSKWMYLAPNRLKLAVEQGTTTSDTCTDSCTEILVVCDGSSPKRLPDKKVSWDVKERMDFSIWRQQDWKGALSIKYSAKEMSYVKA